MRHSVPADWLQEYPLELTLSILRDLASAHARRAGPYSERLLRAIQETDYELLANFELDPNLGVASCDGDDLCAQAETPQAQGSTSVGPRGELRGEHASYLYEAQQALGFFKKFEKLPISADKELTAFTKFLESEEKCRETNVRFRQMLAGRIQPPPAVAYVLHAARLNIARVLGDVPSLDQLHFRFGPGANTTVKASASSPRFKLGSKLACSAELASMASAILEQAPLWCLQHGQEDADDPDLVRVPVEIHHGKLQFVPKNAKTYRSIVVEPILNSFAQKGVGDYLKGRLHLVGVHLDDQSRNQRLARKGSLDGSLCTVDLSSASDTISKEVVNDLLPYDWVSFLGSLRSGTVSYRGTAYPLEKFSSMGNAFTFELETLIFWSIAQACCNFCRESVVDVAVYGDDIIVPTGVYETLVQVLDWFGFEVNLSKSFHRGLFRESCGSDWFFGFDVRPYYQKTLITGETLFTLHNFYARRFDFDMCESVKKWLHPSFLSLTGPDGYGDGHLIGSYTGVTNAKHRARGFEGVVFDTLTRKKRQSFRVTPGDNVLPVYAIYTTSGADQVTDHFAVRGSRGYKRISIYTLARGVFLP